MANKIDLIERLLDEKKITFKEALLLIGEDKVQVKDLTPPIAKDGWDAPDITIIRRILETVLPTKRSGCYWSVEPYMRPFTSSPIVGNPESLLLQKKYQSETIQGKSNSSIAQTYWDNVSRGGNH